MISSQNPKVLEVAAKHAQLLELELLVERNGHGIAASHPEECEVCRQLQDLRREVHRNDRVALSVALNQMRKGL